MPSRFLVMLFLILGSTVGGYLPVFFGADIISYWSVITSAIGGIIGVWLAFRIKV